MSLVGRGRGKGALKTLPSPGAKEPLGACGSDRVMSARITEVLDVVTFWAQIGTGKCRLCALLCMVRVCPAVQTFAISAVCAAIDSRFKESIIYDAAELLSNH